ncbi:hypothetical protein GCM10017567_53290 [Amycolatopsis bullii]|uniref:Uncharacterized protein n=1 Tax=Amycolatopsis bullii TaxID=941987 RepID=A0ABQ3KPR9_9PSEU|nr:hypothetical protein GCM10017567_53290 [Amycolatopsis bullii]
MGEDGQLAGGEDRIGPAGPGGQHGPPGSAQTQPEYEEVRAAAEASGQPLRRVLDEVRALAAS